MHDLLNLIVLLGAVQGMVISTLLFTSRRNTRYSNRLLGFFVLFISLACFNLYAQDSGLAARNDLVRWIVTLVPLVIVMPMGPLLYFYTKAMLDPSFRISKRQRLLFMPVIIDAIPAFTAYVFIIGIVLHQFNPGNQRAWADFIDETNAWSDLPRWVSMMVYVILTKGVFSQAAPAEKEENRWLNHFLNFVVGFQTIWLVFLVPYVIPSIRYRWLDAVTWYPLYIPMTIMVYWVGIRGYIQSQLPLRKSSPAFLPEIVSRTIETLTRAMTEQRMYLDAGLTVVELGSKIGIPQKTISGVINQHLNKSFSEFLNGYRIAEVKKRLLSPEMEHMTITGIALECGFNSQATFQRAFKATGGLSPSEFLEQQRLKSPRSTSQVSS